MQKLKVMVVDDTIVYRKIVSDAVNLTGLAEVECTASNGVLALERLEQCKVDVILMDVFMPDMDGVSTLKILKAKRINIPVIMVSTGGNDSAKVTIEALAAGAMEFILKPTEADFEKNIVKLSKQLQALFAQISVKLAMKMPFMPKFDNIGNLAKDGDLIYQESKTVAKSTQMPPLFTKTVPPVPVKPKKLFTGADVVVIASSTGGPLAIEMFLKSLPVDFEKPILLVQHMPPDFTRILAETLASKYKRDIVEGVEGMPVKSRQIIIAPGGFHMRVKKNGAQKVISVEKGDLVNGVRPAADVLFSSVAEVYPHNRVIALVFTGMGSDGTNGVRQLKSACQCYCLIQNEETCVVYGMPRCINEAGLADEIVPLGDISKRLVEIVSGKGAI